MTPARRASLGVLARRSIELDETIARAATYRTPGGLHVPTHDDIMHFRQDSVAQATDTLELLKQTVHSRDDTRNEWYSVLAKVATMDIQAYVGTLFAGTNTTDLRRDLVDGLAALHGEFLSLALIEYSSTMQRIAHADSKEIKLLEVRRGELRGVIAEQAIMTSLNYDQNPNKIATGSTYEDDVFHRTDAWFYHIDKQLGNHRLPLQIKYSPYDKNKSPIDTRVAAPNDGTTLFYRHYDTSHTHELAKLLVRHLAGEALAQEEEATMIQAHRKLNRDIARHTKHTPGVPVP